MESLFSIFEKFADILPDFAKKIAPICQKNSLTEVEGLTLLLIFLNSDNSVFCDKEVIESLKNKGLLSENSQISSKGAIVSKAVCLALERLKY